MLRTRGRRVIFERGRFRGHLSDDRPSVVGWPLVDGQDGGGQIGLIEEVGAIQIPM